MQYQIKKGFEGHTFGGDGVRNLGNGIVESDHELNSPYLERVDDAPNQNTVASPQAATLSAPAQGVATPPPANTNTAQGVQTPPQNQEGAK